ncbi:MAG: hypothetical protein J0I41_15055 [Filimonas sp.]|nr:hypothetical protein [Filimonas sp.]
MKIILFTAIMAACLFTACKENGTQKTGAAQNVEAVSTKPNNLLRGNVLNALSFGGDTLKKFDSILNQLDAFGVSFQEYIAHGHYELSDSVDKIIEARFPDGMSSSDKKAIDAHHELLHNAIVKYDNSLRLNEQQTAFAEWMFVAYDPIKIFCNDYRYQKEGRQPGLSAGVKDTIAE